MIPHYSLKRIRAVAVDPNLRRLLLSTEDLKHVLGVLPKLVAAYDREQLRLTQISTHWDGCWRHHLLCAEAKVEELQRRVAQLEGQTNPTQG